MKQPKLAIVVPCYNEEEVFSHCLSELQAVLAELVTATLISADSYILFVDDGSRDSTWQLIAQASMDYSTVKGVKLSRNRGHQVALVAGLEAADSDITVSIDADLQDDTSVIALMVKEYLNGNEIVYGVRNDRASDSPFKRKTAGLFYSCMKWMGVQLVPQHADFRLLSDRAKKALLSFKEQNLYLRGLVPLIGYRSTQVAYSRTVRLAGESKYPLKKMLALAIEGITSLTITPLRIIAISGFAISILSVFAAIYALFEKFSGNTVEGWASVMIAIFFLGGVQMLSLGIIGEYVGKIYMEAKARPKYFIEKTTQQKVDDE
ncbi:TPA: glycosyltransferase family 2 protein [Raoultella ornithinolytica]|uniref:glycosyltransferase family 2 protein n=1 Tax=Raoultella ornithinolytica TaxID=54291 RepID=UPI001968549F|nr:glycosyltransferase family 2 protein [Raoultella ornithinolytica]QSA10819.1 glycosyltransferase family 2 protein [Raoultella ornithinolytica]HDV8762480.1 glycosyltransferase family 2 protein [Raoultella ornithinolytica]